MQEQQNLSRNSCACQQLPAGREMAFETFPRRRYQKKVRPRG